MSYPYDENPLRVTDQTLDVLEAVAAERERQEKKWGRQSYPTGARLVKVFDDVQERAAKGACERAAREKKCTWRHILGEEVAEFNNALGDVEAEKELLQVAAVAVSAIEDLRRKRGATRGQR